MTKQIQATLAKELLLFHIISTKLKQGKPMNGTFGSSDAKGTKTLASLPLASRRHSKGAAESLAASGDTFSARGGLAFCCWRWTHPQHPQQDSKKANEELKESKFKANMQVVSAFSSSLLYFVLICVFYVLHII